MDQAVSLFCDFVLTFFSMTVPIMTVLLSVFQEGILKLQDQFKNEKKQSEEKLESQLKEKGKTDPSDLDAIEKTIMELRTIKKKAEKKLEFLDPKKQLIQLFFPLIISFLFLIFYFIFDIDFQILKINIHLPYFFLIFGFLSFCYSLYIFLNLSLVIFEVVKIINLDKSERESKTIELITKLVETTKKGSNIFLKKIIPTFNGRDIIGTIPETMMTINVKQDYKIGLRNKEGRIAKNTELGLIIPKDFIIEQTASSSIYTNSDGTQIVRFESDYIHADTHMIYHLIVTPIAAGVFKIKVFIKGENVEILHTDFKVKVI